MSKREDLVVELAREVVLDGPPLINGACFYCDQPIKRVADHAGYCFWAQLAAALDAGSGHSGGFARSQ
jgi:hypothetical protein